VTSAPSQTNKNKLPLKGADLSSILLITSGQCGQCQGSRNSANNVFLGRGQLEALTSKHHSFHRQVWGSTGRM
jgi:hypothetical protein